MNRSHGIDKDAQRISQRFTFLALLFFWGPIGAADFTGQVVGIIAGDTIEVLHTNRAERIRLSGIDCLKKGQR